ncbi:unnamed protein product [Cuscuta epithymum]|uniref:HORMA domain-containing protein n=1 Tax=Cuscuta epithymum TaxID=186058 RepID=A0AAV0EAD4_9ASTE|nr:unnamed protein product [Cuscuta epithymum]
MAFQQQSIAHSPNKFIKERKNLAMFQAVNCSLLNKFIHEKYFLYDGHSYATTEFSIPKDVDAYTHELINFMKQGVYGAIKRKHLKSVYFYAYGGAAQPEEVCSSNVVRRTQGDGVLPLPEAQGAQKRSLDSFSFEDTNQSTSSNLNRDPTLQMMFTMSRLLRDFFELKEERSIGMRVEYNDKSTDFRGIVSNEVTTLERIGGETNMDHFMMDIYAIDRNVKHEDGNEMLV